jgi:hypothetical protein
MTRRRENSCPYRDSNSDSLVVQPVAIRYTDSLSRLCETVSFFIMVLPTTVIALALSVCCYSARACLLFICTEIPTRCLPTRTLTYLSLPTLVPRFRGLQCSDTSGVQQELPRIVLELTELSGKLPGSDVSLCV